MESFKGTRLSQYLVPVLSHSITSKSSVSTIISGKERNIIINVYILTANVNILANDKIKKSAFVIRVLQWSTFIDRTFCAETEGDR